ncbi:MAG: ribosome-associated translation inhibitor RaiA [Phycisphaeraceae bacterium]|nr:ribosome-associated translation inhibitor RaiA [Phycisphaeraceae bacterium]MBX3406251.1 ribosome-associated translation inhibitor RaiA [Phycisphaeraceae bacterium]
MRIDVVGKHMDITDPIRKYAETKAERLLKYFNGTQQIRVILEAGKKSDFMCEIAVDVVKHKDFIAHATAKDLYAAIDECVDKAQRQVHDFKERLKG